MEYTIRDLLSAVFRHTRGLVVFWVATLAVVLIFYTQTRKTYDSKAKILVSLGTEAQGKAEYLNEKNLQLLQREQQIHDEQQILQSHEVLLTAARWILGVPQTGVPAPTRDWKVEEARRFITGEEPEPTLLLRSIHDVAWYLGKLSGQQRTQDEQLEDVARELGKKLSVNPVFDSDALDVTFRYRDPRVAQTILSLILTAYMEHHIKVFQSAAEGDLLRTQYDQSVEKYHDRLAQFSSYMTTHGVYSDDTQMNSMMEQRERLNQSLTQALADDAADLAKLKSLTGIQHSLQQFEKFSSTEVRNKQRDDLLSKLNEATVEQRALLSRHPEGSRAYQEEQSKLDEIRRLVNLEPATVVNQTEQRRTKASELVESEVINTTEAHHGDQARISQLRHDLALNEGDLKHLAIGLSGFDALKLDLSLAKAESEQMAKAYVDSHLKTLTSQSAITDVSVIDGPTWDWRPASPKQSIVAAASGALLFLGSIAVLLGLIATDETVNDPRTAKLRLGTDVVGTFPMPRNKEDEADFFTQFERYHQPEFARIYQTIRKDRSDGRVIVVAESNSGEGATLIGYGLAQFLSNEAHERTAFIDRTAGTLVPVRTSTQPGHTLTVIGRAEMKKDALNGSTSLRQQYTNIVIASGAVKDATNMLGVHGPSTVTFLVVEAGKTRRAAARFSIEQLHEYGFRNVRLILNRRRLYIPSWLMRYV